MGDLEESSVPVGVIARPGTRLGLDLHAGDFNTPKALERCWPVLQSDEKWPHAAIFAHYSPYMVLEEGVCAKPSHSGATLV